MIDLDIPRLAALAEAATPGKRVIEMDAHCIDAGGKPYAAIEAGRGFYGDGDGHGFRISGIISQEDADLAALAPETLAALIRRLQAAEAERDSRTLWCRHPGCHIRRTLSMRTRTTSVVVLALHDEIDQTRATLSAAEAELAATRAAIAEWRKEHWAAAADTTLMETLDRIAQGILE